MQLTKHTAAASLPPPPPEAEARGPRAGRRQGRSPRRQQFPLPQPSKSLTCRGATSEVHLQHTWGTRPGRVRSARRAARDSRRIGARTRAATTGPLAPRDLRRSAPGRGRPAEGGVRLLLPRPLAVTAAMEGGSQSAPALIHSGRLRQGYYYTADRLRKNSAKLDRAASRFPRELRRPAPAV